MADYWLSPVGEKDDFGDTISDTIIDGKTSMGPWALMTEKSWARYSGTQGRLGLGLGQKYCKQPDGKWLKVENNSKPLAIEGFKQKHIQGLYSYLHFERADGAWYQVSLDMSNPKVTYCENGRAAFEQFANLEELRKYLK